MEADFFSLQIDYVSFFSGLASILMAATAAALHAHAGARSSWRWLALFGLAYGVSQWLDLLAVSFPDGTPFAFVRLAVMAASFACLLEFGRSASAELGARTPRAWIHAPLAGMMALCGVAGISGADAGARYAFGFPGALWGAWALWHYQRRNDPERFALNVAAGAMAMYAVATGLVVPRSALLTASLVNHESFAAIFGLPAQLVSAVCAAVLATALWQHFWTLRRKSLRGFAPARRKASCAWLPAGVVLVVLFGWGLAEHAGARAQQQGREAVLLLAKAAAGGVAPETLKALRGAPGDERHPEYARLRAQLMAIGKAIPGVRYLYVFGRRDERIFFYIDTEPNAVAGVPLEPTAVPGDTYDESTASVIEVFELGKSAIVGPETDRWGTFLSGLVPIHDPATAGVLAVLGADVELTVEKASVAQQRLMPIVVTLLIALLLVSFFVMRQRQDDKCAALSFHAGRYRLFVERFRGIAYQSEAVAARPAFFHGTVEQLTGYAPEDFTGGRVAWDSLVLAEDLPQVLDARTLVESTPDRCVRVEYRIRSRDGTVLWVRDTSYAVRDADGRLECTDGFIQDITEERALDAKVRLANEQLELALKGGDLGLWDWEVASGRVAVNERWARMLGYAPDEIAPHVRSWEGLTHPDDLARAKSLLEQYFQGRIPCYEAEVRMRAKSGPWRWILSRCKVVEWSADGKPLRVVGTNLDVTEKKAALEALQAGRAGACETAKGAEGPAGEAQAPGTDEAREHGPLDGMSVLVVAEHDSCRRAAAQVLHQLGCTCDEVAEANEARGALRGALPSDRPYKAVVIEACGERLDGGGLCEEIKADVALREAAVVMLVPFGDTERMHTLRTRGADACVTLPVRRTALSECLQSLSRRTAAPRPAPPPPAPPCESAPEAVPGIRILIAEDNPVNQRVALAIVKLLGYQADVVGNGLQALRALETTSYEAVLMDVQMPEMDGLEATRKIRAPDSHVRNHRIPVIAMTAHAMSGDRESFLAAGMDDYLSKPVRPEEVGRALQRWIKTGRPAA